ncbi:MAG: hypothetical protein ACRET8_06485 [Burkholderiales bacterium]
MTATRFITIQFNDGSSVRYSFPIQSTNKAAQQLKIEDLLKGRHLLIHAEGRLVIYPIENIRKIELSAGSGDNMDGIRLPAHAIRDAKLV